MFDGLFSQSGLSLDRLRSFLAFAEAGSIAKAAPGDVNLQSQMSRQISELEAFFSTELTERRGKTLALSSAGQRLATLIREQLQDLDDFRREQTEVKKVFAIGAGASILDWLVIPAIKGVRAALDQASVRLEVFRSQMLVEEVKNGRLDFAVVREDALPEGAPRLPVISITFHLCVPRRLLNSGTPAKAVSDSKLWQTLPFTTGKDGGQLDQTVRKAMLDAGVDFRPVVECNSILQARQLIERGECAGILPSVGIQGLSSKEIIVSEFAPLKNYGRSLVLHWNERQMRRRGVGEATIKELGKALAKR
jgi:DNA-binding transcriptional LysR family regulator